MQENERRRKEKLHEQGQSRSSGGCGPGQDDEINGSELCRETALAFDTPERLFDALASRAEFVDGPSLTGQYAARIESCIQAQSLKRLHDFIEVFKSPSQGQVASLLPYFDSLFSLDDIGADFHSLRFKWLSCGFGPACRSAYA